MRIQTITKYGLVSLCLTLPPLAATAQDCDDWHEIISLSSSETVIRHCLRQGLDLTARDEHNFTVLHVAAIRSSSEIIQILLDAGADPSAVNDNGHYPYHLAMMRSITVDPDLVERLRQGVPAHVLNCNPAPSGFAC
jgi:ankyrin repeat protein